MAAARILFLCTGNDHRSRFAEIVFNTRAWPHRSCHVAFSPGLVLLRGDA